MKYYILALVSLLMTTSVMAGRTPQLTKRQKQTLTQLRERHTKTLACQIRKAPATNSFEEQFSVVLSSNPDSVVYSREGKKNNKYVFTYNDDKSLQSITTKNCNSGNEWEDNTRYDITYNGTDFTSTLSFAYGGLWETVSRTTYYDGNKDSYLKESYTDGVWEKTDSQIQKFDADGNITSETSSYYLDGKEYESYCIVYNYVDGKLSTINYFELDDDLVTVHKSTDAYTYDAEGRVAKITSDSWYEEFSYTDTEIICTDYDMLNDGTFYKCAVFTSAINGNEFSPYREEYYNQQGQLEEGCYATYVPANNPMEALYSYYEYNNESKAYEPYYQVNITWRDESTYNRMVYSTYHNGYLYLSADILYTYLDDGRYKSELTRNEDGFVFASTVYFYSDNTSDPTSVKSPSITLSHSDKIYDMLGRSLTTGTQQHGIYIKDGKKFLKKRQ